MASKSSYLELLRDPRWQKKRLEIFERDGWMCQSCAATDKTLNVHHRQYARNRKPWEYDENWLVTLCEDCHVAYGMAKDAMLDALRPLTDSEMEGIAGVADALVACRPGRRATVKPQSYNYAIGVGMVIGVHADYVLLMGDIDPGPLVFAHNRRLLAQKPSGLPDPEAT